MRTAGVASNSRTHTYRGGNSPVQTPTAAVYGCTLARRPPHAHARARRSPCEAAHIARLGFAPCGTPAARLGFAPCGTPRPSRLATLPQQVWEQADARARRQKLRRTAAPSAGAATLLAGTAAASPGVATAPVEVPAPTAGATAPSAGVSARVASAKSGAQSALAGAAGAHASTAHAHARHDHELHSCAIIVCGLEREVSERVLAVHGVGADVLTVHGVGVDVLA
eukprot:363220-Chlamydomonas_euryale.AAC.1